jgi:hypothetical protein
LFRYSRSPFSAAFNTNFVETFITKLLQKF